MLQVTRYDPKPLGSFLRSLRLATLNNGKALTQEELSYRIPIKRGRIIAVERGQGKRPDQPFLTRYVECTTEKEEDLRHAFILGGYGFRTTLPSLTETVRGLEGAIKRLSDSPFPAYICDRLSSFWIINSVCAAFTREIPPISLLEQRTDVLDLFLSPRFSLLQSRVGGNAIEHFSEQLRRMKVISAEPQYEFLFRNYPQSERDRFGERYPLLEELWERITPNTPPRDVDTFKWPFVPPNGVPLFFETFAQPLSVAGEFFRLITHQPIDLAENKRNVEAYLQPYRMTDKKCWTLWEVDKRQAEQRWDSYRG